LTAANGSDGPDIGIVPEWNAVGSQKRQIITDEPPGIRLRRC
jgi:hypothetical protein